MLLSSPPPGLVVMKQVPSDPSQESKALLYCLVARAGSTTTGSLFKVAEHHLSSFNFSSRPAAALRTVASRQAICSQPHVSFTTVRNPFDRLISAFICKAVLAQAANNCGGGGGGPGLIVERRTNASVITGHLSFGEFVQRICSTPSGREDVNVHWRSASATCRAEALPYDIVGRSENLSEALGRMSSRMGWEEKWRDEVFSYATRKACSRDPFCSARYLSMLSPQHCSG